MAKKTVGVSLRKPPPPADLDAFVSAAATNDDDKTPASGLHALAKVETRPDVVVASSSGRSFRELTLYVPQDLAQRLGVHCAENDRDMSNVVAEAVAKILEPPPPPSPIVAEAEANILEPPPVPGWRKPLARFEGTIKLIRHRLGGHR